MRCHRFPKSGDSLADVFSSIASELSDKNSFTSYEYCKTSHEDVWWYCPKGHKDYLASINNRTRKIKPTNCPECWEERRGKASAKPRPFHSFGDLYPELLLEWDKQNKVNPYSLKPRSEYLASWVCSKGHTWEAYVSNRSSQNTQCPYCTNKKLLKGFNDLETKFPSISSEFNYQKNGIKSDEVLYGSRNSYWFTCSKCGNEWKSSVENRTRQGKGCRKCSTTESIPENILRSSLVPFGALPTAHKLGKWNVDIFFPDSKTVVEYDGSYYHSFEKSYERDRRKSLDLLGMGYRVVRVRTWSKGYELVGLGIIDLSYYEIFSLDQPNNQDIYQKILDIL